MPWPDDVPATLMTEVEQNGVKTQVPLKDQPFIKESPSLDHFVQRAWEVHRENGARLPLRVDKTKPDEIKKWRTDNLPKLYAAGVLEAPPASPDAYVVEPPTDIPEGLAWSAERAGKLKAVAHKWGMPPGAVADLVALHRESLESLMPKLQTSMEVGLAAVKAEWGDKYDATVELTKRLTKEIFKLPGELEAWEDSGLGNHPQILSVLMRIAARAGSDSSIIPNSGGSSGGTMNGDEVRAAVADIMTNKANPRYEGYHRRDKVVMDYIEGLYKAAYGDGKVTI